MQRRSVNCLQMSFAAPLKRLVCTLSENLQTPTRTLEVVSNLMPSDKDSSSDGKSTANSEEFYPSRFESTRKIINSKFFLNLDRLMSADANSDQYLAEQSSANLIPSSSSLMYPIISQLRQSKVNPHGGMYQRELCYQKSIDKLNEEELAFCSNRLERPFSGSRALGLNARTGNRGGSINDYKSTPLEAYRELLLVNGESSSPKRSADESQVNWPLDGELREALQVLVGSSDASFASNRTLQAQDRSSSGSAGDDAAVVGGGAGGGAGGGGGGGGDGVDGSDGQPGEQNVRLERLQVQSSQQNGTSTPPMQLNNSNNISDSKGPSGLVKSETATEDASLECKKREYTFRAMNRDNKGNHCSGFVKATICYGGCETGEISDWLFPHKKSIHKVCQHGQRVKRKVILPDCNSLIAVKELSIYHFVDARSCKCEKCNKTNTTCMGSLTAPKL